MTRFHHSSRKRALVPLAAVCAVAVGCVSGCGAEGSGYEVDAVFDNASNVVIGGDVKVAGATVGSVVATHVSPSRKAVVTIRITDPSVRVFRRDASCRIVLQSLIGERFVECRPTQLRAAGTPPPPLLTGHRTIPVTQTSSPVDLDLVLGITRLPERERLTLILNELGAGLAGRGEDLGATIERSVPALRDTRAVLDVLARQRRQLADLVVRADQLLAPLADARKELAGGITGLAATTSALARQRAALSSSVAQLPATLRDLRPALHDLDAFASTSEPLVRDLRRVAPTLADTVRGLPPALGQARGWITELGVAARQITPALPGVERLLAAGRRFVDGSGTSIPDLGSLLRAFEGAGGPKALIDLLYNASGAVGTYDRYGHVARASVIITCTTMAAVPSGDCLAKPPPVTKASTSRATATASSTASAGTADTRSATTTLLDYLMGG